jgi:hypothetical protein
MARSRPSLAAKIDSSIQEKSRGLQDPHIECGIGMTIYLTAHDRWLRGRRDWMLFVNGSTLQRRAEEREIGS